MLRKAADHDISRLNSRLGSPAADQKFAAMTHKDSSVSDTSNIPDTDTGKAHTTKLTADLHFVAAVLRLEFSAAVLNMKWSPNLLVIARLVMHCAKTVLDRASDLLATYAGCSHTDSNEITAGAEECLIVPSPLLEFMALSLLKDSMVMQICLPIMTVLSSLAMPTNFTWQDVSPIATALDNFLGQCSSIHTNEAFVRRARDLRRLQAATVPQMSGTGSERGSPPTADKALFVDADDATASPDDRYDGNRDNVDAALFFASDNSSNCAEEEVEEDDSDSDDGNSNTGGVETNYQTGSSGLGTGYLVVLDSTELQKWIKICPSMWRFWGQAGTVVKKVNQHDQPLALQISFEYDEQIIINADKVQPLGMRSSNPTKPRWLFEGTANEWHSFSQEQSKVVEMHYTTRRNLPIEYAVRGSDYRLDFTTMIQTNISSGNTRRVVRESARTSSGMCHDPICYLALLELSIGQLCGVYVRDELEAFALSQQRFSQVELSLASKRVNNKTQEQPKTGKLAAAAKTFRLKLFLECKQLRSRFLLDDLDAPTTVHRRAVEPLVNAKQTPAAVSGVHWLKLFDTDVLNDLSAALKAFEPQSKLMRKISGGKTMQHAMQLFVAVCLTKTGGVRLAQEYAGRIRGVSAMNPEDARSLVRQHRPPALLQSIRRASLNFKKNAARAYEAHKVHVYQLANRFASQIVFVSLLVMFLGLLVVTLCLRVYIHTHRSQDCDLHVRGGMKRKCRSMA